MLYELESLSTEVFQDGKKITILRDINLSAKRGSSLGIVGESGSGKSTLGRTLLFLQRPSRGKVFFEGVDLASLSTSDLRARRKNMQMVFQDPASALNPRMTVRAHLEEALSTHHLFRNEAQLVRLLDQVRLPRTLLDRYPFELSGGQKQRISIARAISVEPSLLVLDEPLSSLDTSIRAQILELLQELGQKSSITYFFITHDMESLRESVETTAVLYLGSIVEIAPTGTLLSGALHPYTQSLLAAIPIPDPEREKERPRSILKGDPPSFLHPPSGCPFHPRCLAAQPICREERPDFRQVEAGHSLACHFPGVAAGKRV
jgi:oligopeptide/dipeptide ABC transporter ATP-binding protein